MIIKQKILRSVSLTAHPLGCAADTRSQIDWVRKAAAGKKDPYKSEHSELPKTVLVIGGSTGYGLATRIVSAFVGGSDTVNVSFEREATEKKTATPGWYNTKAFEKEAHREGLKADSVFGDAFSDEIKQQTIELLKKAYRKVDLVVYSLASPMRVDPVTGETYRSVLKPIGSPYSAKSIDPFTEEVSTATIEPADESNIEQTVKVMGGEDWQLWIRALQSADLLAKGVKTVAFSYIGPEVTFPIYREGTIGKAKEHLEATAKEITEQLEDQGGSAYVSVNKALVTRASAVIPVVPLYITILYKVMKDRHLHEGCIEQMYRMMTERLYSGAEVPVDSAGRIRLDDWEMREDVQQQVAAAWEEIDQNTLASLADLEGFKKEYEQIHGFGLPGIDYDADIDPRVID